MEKYAAFDHLIEGVQVIDPQWRYVYVNYVVARHGKAPKPSFKGQAMMDKYPGIEHTEMFDRLRSCMSSQTPAQFINEFDFPDGSSGWFELSMQPVEEGVLILSFDITPLKRVEAQLAQQLDERKSMVKQLEEQKAQLEEFCQIIAHNIRAPLANLLLLNEMITNAQEADEVKLLVEKQHPVVSSLHETFEELVDAIQVRTDYTIKAEQIELELATQHAMNLLQGEILKHAVVITIDFSAAPYAIFPKLYLESVLFNLISNAIKYSSTQRKPEIKLSSYIKDNWLHVEVSDNGLGIDLVKYGNKLFRLRKTFHNHPNAKGLGLFMTKNQIEAMGGSISVHSTIDEGTTFILKLNKYSDEEGG